MLDVIESRTGGRFFEKGSGPLEYCDQVPRFGPRCRVLADLSESSGMPFQSIDAREHGLAAL